MNDQPSSDGPDFTTVVALVMLWCCAFFVLAAAGVLGWALWRWAIGGWGMRLAVIVFLYWITYLLMRVIWRMEDEDARDSGGKG